MHSWNLIKNSLSNMIIIFWYVLVTNFSKLSSWLSTFTTVTVTIIWNSTFMKTNNIKKINVEHKKVCVYIKYSNLTKKVWYLISHDFLVHNYFSSKHIPFSFFHLIFSTWIYSDTLYCTWKFTLCVEKNLGR